MAQVCSDLVQKPYTPHGAKGAEAQSAAQLCPRRCWAMSCWSLEPALALRDQVLLESLSLSL